jgi:hypothetical protein
MPLWQERIFAAIMRNASRVTDYFRLPTEQVVEIGRQISIGKLYFAPRSALFPSLSRRRGVMKGSGLYTSARQCLLLAQSGHPDTLDQCLTRMHCNVCF